MVSQLAQEIHTSVLRHLIEHGWAQHYTDLAVEFGVGTGRRLAWR